MERMYHLCLTWALTCLVTICGTLWVNGEEVETETSLDLYAQSAVLMDANTGRILYGRNENAKLAMASTTKIMTCLVALENSSLKDTVNISEYAASMPDVQLNARAGDTFYMEDLLYSLMLESHNDVAVAIAEHVAGTEEAFAKLMNERAEQIGCYTTNFVTANGLDAEEHYTTANDLAKITQEALKNDTFCKIIQTADYTFTNIGQTQRYNLYNKNVFLNQMQGAYGVKTGFTNDAGYCFVGAAKQKGINLITVVLGSGWPPNKEWKWKDTWNLMTYGFENYTYKKVGEVQMDIGKMIIENGQKACVKLYAETEIVPLLVNSMDHVTVKVIRELKKEAPIAKDEIVGWVYYQINDFTVNKYPIYPGETVNRKNYLDCLRTIGRAWILY